MGMILISASKPHEMTHLLVESSIIKGLDFTMIISHYMNPVK